MKNKLLLAMVSFVASYTNIAEAFALQFKPYGTRALVPGTTVLQDKHFRMTPRQSHIDMTKESDSSTKQLLSMYELTAPAMLDRDAMFWSCVIQTSITGLVLLLCSLFHVDILRKMSLHFDDVKIIAIFTASLLGVGYIVDQLPLGYLQDRFRETKHMLLHLLGRNTPKVRVAYSVGVVSLFAAIAEETLFRGFLFTAISEFMHENVIAIVVSSVVSGLVRFPGLGINTALKSLLSSVMCAAYITSGYNLLVPILIHALYDSGTMLRSWMNAASDLKGRLRESVQYQLTKGKKPGTTLAASPGLGLGPAASLGGTATSSSEPADDLRDMSRMVFNFLDMNHDGRIGQPELAQGLHIFSEKSRTLPELMEKADHFFSHLDKDLDGEIEYADFLSAVQHEADENGGVYWLPEAAAITELEEREKTFLQKLREMRPW